ncbi:MAG: alanine--glyoxylate aminotransferase family protein [Chloroflexota bacterium]|nr:MAG: alanine--glyoxylate aminotransferase family protein [Chloroflexota bacterium]
MAPMFVPGPVDVDVEVLNAQSRAMLPHRSEEFETIYRRASEKAKQLFQTEAPILIATCSGTGLQEAAIRNLAKQSVLSCVNGAFSQRWFEVARSNGKQAELLEVEWGQPITPQKIAKALQGKNFEMVTLVHNETSTGVLNPIEQIAALVHQVSPDTIICIDAVSSLGGIPIKMDAWGLDMVLTSSQKCLALPPGLALAAVSDRALNYAKEVPDRGWYFDLIRMETHRNKDSTPATPAMSLIFALDLQLDRILKEGLENRFSRHKAMAELVQSWVKAKGFQILAEEGYRSLTVTTVSNSLNLDIAALNAFLLAKDMRIAEGYGKLKNHSFRIAHMGETQLADIQELLSALDEFIAQK